MGTYGLFCFGDKGQLVSSKGRGGGGVKAIK